jgi:hypothetical protein
MATIRRRSHGLRLSDRAANLDFLAGICSSVNGKSEARMASLCHPNCLQSAEK